ncbi:AraC family transcriptional regulator [Thioclava sp. BHET1]|nr:AraC family transcriptional regulator [Thioclava sp. BHET1]
MQDAEFPRAEPIVSRGIDYPDGYHIAPHRHERAQLLYGMTGVVLVSTETGAWLMPPDRGLWIPPGIRHEVRMIGPVAMRSLYLRSDLITPMPESCAVLEIPDLTRALLAEAVRLPQAAPLPERAAALWHLLLIEIGRLRTVPLSLPLPVSPALRALCEAFLLAPDATLDLPRICDRLHLSRRSFTRHFRAETGMSFVDWRQRACALAAIPRLQAGVPVTLVAMDLGYDTPAAFSAMFRRVTGQAPRAYARQNRALEPAM